MSALASPKLRVSPAPSLDTVIRTRTFVVRDLPTAAPPVSMRKALAYCIGWGLRRVGQILDLPRPTLARRLGERLLLRLDEIPRPARPSPLILPPEQTVFLRAAQIVRTDQSGRSGAEALPLAGRNGW